MLKRYCDKCGEIIDGPNDITDEHTRWVLIANGKSASITIEVDSVGDPADFCLTCILTEIGKRYPRLLGLELVGVIEEESHKELASAYRLVRCWDTEQGFVRAVNAAIAEGWKPMGGVSVESADTDSDYQWFTQAMRR